MLEKEKRGILWIVVCSSAVNFSLIYKLRNQIKGFAIKTFIKYIGSFEMKRQRIWPHEKLLENNILFPTQLSLVKTFG